MSLSESTISQLQSLKDAGDMASAESYYNILAANGHDYGNLAAQAATDTGFWRLGGAKAFRPVEWAPGQGNRT